jgi:hypothetical protein
MKNTNFIGKLVVIALLLTGFTAVYAEDLIFNSFEEAQKAAEQRSAEYDRRMAEHVATVDKAWEKQNTDIGENTNLDLSKISESRETEQTAENERNSRLQDNVTNSINTMKQQMINTASANTVGFAGAAAGYSWKVSYKDGKYVLSDTYDQAFFVSGRSGDTTTKTITGENEKEANGDKTKTNDDNEDTIKNPNSPEITEDNPSTPTDNPSEYQIANLPDNLDYPSNTENEEDDDEEEGSITPESQLSPVDRNTDLEPADRVVYITIQHPTTFKEEIVEVSENDINPNRTLKDFVLPEDTRVKISAKSNINVENTHLTMRIVDEEGEGEDIDSESMKNYRHMFRIPAKDKYFVNIYVNYDDNSREPKKIASLCLPVESVDFGSRMISK